MKKYVIYTDGSCLGNPGPGGWGVLIKHDGEDVILRGGAAGTTNNRMEMTAVIEALKWMKGKQGVVEIYSDSSLVVNSMKDGWKRKANLDLWAEMDKAIVGVEGIDINWNWVKGHSDNKFNEIVDKIAVEESKKIEKEGGIEDLVKHVKKGDGYFCKKCNQGVSGRLSYNSESDMIRVDCENCGSYIMFAEKSLQNLKEAKKRVLINKAQLEKVKKIMEEKGEKFSEKEIKTWSKDDANDYINSDQKLWD